VLTQLIRCSVKSDVGVTVATCFVRWEKLCLCRTEPCTRHKNQNCFLSRTVAERLLFPHAPALKPSDSQSIIGDAQTIAHQDSEPE